MFLPEEIFIFLGPSLPLSEAKALLDASYFPPAAQGDIISMTRQFRPKVIGLIDGNFRQTRAVWHKEILYALSQGVIMVGASSMGALRAAETADFGMIGVGKIFERYRTGEIEDDDEVVLIHGPEEDYLGLSIPLINLRFTLEFASREEKLPKELCEEFFSIAQSLYYPERTLDKILEQAKKKNLPESLIEQVFDFLKSNYIDQKKEDACSLLKKINSLSVSDIPPKKEVVVTTLEKKVYDLHRRIRISDVDLTPEQIYRYISLNHPRFSEILFNALNQTLATTLADNNKIEVTEEEIEKEKQRLYFRNKIKNEEAFIKWLNRNHLTEDECYSLIEEKARVRKLHRWLGTDFFPARVLDELKLNNDYEEWVEKAALQQEYLEKVFPCYEEEEHPEITKTDLIINHLKETKWRPELHINEWSIETGYRSLFDLMVELHKAKVSRDYQKKLLPLE